LKTMSEDELKLYIELLPAFSNHFKSQILITFVA
jgi:hypothetical protein